MKTSFIILCTIFLTGSTVESQIIRSMGFNAGYVYAQEDWKYAPQTGITAAGIEPISGFSGSVFVEFFDLHHFSLLTKLLYVGKGRSMTVMGTKINPANPNGISF